MEFPNGAILKSRYRIVHKIGSGGMGQVYECLDELTGEPVALKILDQDLIDDPIWVQRFEQEALAATRIGHESICRVSGSGQAEDGTLYIVMELLRGHNLMDEIVASGPLSEVRLLWIMLPVLSALGAAHQSGIIHRDLKPENLFLALQPDGTEAVKLLDFGISKVLSKASSLKLTETGTVLGTPWYMAPEQAKGLKEIDHRADIWSMGVVIYEALTGGLPFRGETYNSSLVQIIFNEPIPPSACGVPVRLSLEALILRALSKDPNDRPQSAAELAFELERAVSDDRETTPM